MKNIKFILNCVVNSIKKKIFKSQKTDITQKYEKLPGSIEMIVIQEEEYLNNYNTATRWQTV